MAYRAGLDVPETTRRRSEERAPAMVLIIVDSAAMRAVLADVVRAQDLIAVPAADIPQALALVQMLPVGFVIIGTDTEPEVVKTFKRSVSRAPVLALCFEADVHEPAQCSVRGADDLLCWPFTLTVLVDAIRRLVRPAFGATED
jgi:DNA-binding response OmpR family regulator